MDQQTLSPARKLEYLFEKLAIMCSEVRAVTGQAWDITATLYSSDQQPEMIAVAEKCGLKRAEWNEDEGGSYSKHAEGVNLYMYDATMPHTPPATDPDALAATGELEADSMSAAAEEAAGQMIALGYAQ